MVIAVSLLAPALPIAVGGLGVLLHGNPVAHFVEAILLVAWVVGAEADMTPPVLGISPEAPVVAGGGNYLRLLKDSLAHGTSLSAHGTGLCAGGSPVRDSHWFVALGGNRPFLSRRALGTFPDFKAILGAGGGCFYRPLAPAVSSLYRPFLSRQALGTFPDFKAILGACGGCFYRPLAPAVFAGSLYRPFLSRRALGTFTDLKAILGAGSGCFYRPFAPAVFAGSLYRPFLSRRALGTFSDLKAILGAGSGCFYRPLAPAVLTGSGIYDPCIITAAVSTVHAGTVSVFQAGCGLLRVNYSAVQFRPHHSAI